MKTPAQARLTLFERIQALTFAVQADEQCLRAVQKVKAEHEYRLRRCQEALAALPAEKQEVAS